MVLSLDIALALFIVISELIETSLFAPLVRRNEKIKLFSKKHVAKSNNTIECEKVRSNHGDIFYLFENENGTIGFYWSGISSFIRICSCDKVYYYDNHDSHIEPIYFLKYIKSISSIQSVNSEVYSFLLKNIDIVRSRKLTEKYSTKSYDCIDISHFHRYVEPHLKITTKKCSSVHLSA